MDVRFEPFQQQLRRRVMAGPERLFGIENEFHIARVERHRFPAWPDDDPLPDTERPNRSGPRRIPIFIGQRVNRDGGGIEPNPLDDRGQCLTHLGHPALLRPVEMNQSIFLPDPGHPGIVQQPSQFAAVHIDSYPHINPILSHYYLSSFTGCSKRPLSKATGEASAGGVPSGVR